MQVSKVDTTPRVYFLDLEVDSVPVDQGEPRCCITQLCVYDPMREKGKRIFEAYIKPPMQLRRKEEEISFAHEQTQKPKYEFKMVWPYLKKWVNEGLDGKRFAVIAGHNMYKNDWPILQNECARIQEAIPKYWKPFCTLYLAGALGIPKGEQSLASLCQRYEIQHLRQHVAYNDVKMLVNVFGKMIEDADFDKIANAMALPPNEHPIREVVNVIRSTQEAVLVFFDFEATGLFPKKGEEGEIPRATELAGYIPSKDATFCSLIDPGLDEGIKLKEEVKKLTGIDEEMIRKAGVEYKEKAGKEMNFKAIWTDFENWMDHEIGPTVRKVKVLAGHNIWGYDLLLYKADSERFGMKTIFWKSIDTCALSRNIYKGHKPQPKGFHSLQENRKRMGLAENNAHRALGDVMVNYNMYNKFVDGVPQEKLNEALLSKHPVLSTGVLVREEGGTFKPENYMEVPKEKSPEENRILNGKGKITDNPFVVDEEKGGSIQTDFFGFGNNKKPVIITTPKDNKPSLKRTRDDDPLENQHGEQKCSRQDEGMQFSTQKTPSFGMGVTSTESEKQEGTKKRKLILEFSDSQ